MILHSPQILKPAYMQFTFTHNAAGILPFILKATQYIKDEYIGNRDDKEQLLNRCKFVITELCTNGIKHAGRAESVFTITMQDDSLLIARQDDGAPLNITWKETNLQVPLPEDISTVTLMEDDINCLRMQRLHAYSVKFYTQPITPIALHKPPKLNEHFGLIIICLSTDSFVYVRDEATGTNTFTATINL